MDELGFNKIAAAILATALGFMGIKEISHSAMHVSAPDKPVYSVGPMEVETPGETIELPFPQPEWIAAMDATKGAKVFKKCTSCHNADQGGANGTGPNLWNVVGAAAGQHENFKYSGAMANSGLTWDFETLNDYLTKPTKYLSGTAMNFIGLKKEGDRAAVIEYLRQQADTPVAQPVAAVTETAEDTAELDAPNDTVLDQVEDAMDTVADTAGDVVEGAEDIAEDTIDAVEDAAKSVVDTVKDQVTKSEPETEKNEDGDH